MLAYGTNKKTLKIHDMRASSREVEAGVSFKYEEKENKNFFTDLVSSYTSVEFLKNGKYIAARDFLTVKVWDVCNNKKPVLDVTLQDNYKAKLCDMF
jgi:serine/threonine-protein phosphatase 2A regulatory subunit B